MKDRSFDFSVVMSVYNVEPFIREAVDSLIRQTIGFDRIQLIMVDDGSTDQSGAICDEYRAKYPENVMVIHKENGGLSSARNTGLPHVKGSYISFIDPDDTVKEDAFAKVKAFMDANPDVDISCIPYFCFGLWSGPHYLNNKFEQGTRVIDLLKDENAGYILISSATGFYRASVASELCFDTRLCTAEDIKENLKILLKNPKLGVVADTQYNYRKHGSSISSNSSYKVGYYLDTLRYFPEWALDTAESCYGKVPKFVQNMVMCDLQWRLQRAHIPEGVLTDEEKQEYKILLMDIACRIDDDVLLAHENIGYERLLYFLNHKHRSTLQYSKSKSIMENGCADKETISTMLCNLPTHINNIWFQDQKMVIEGYQSCIISELPEPTIHIIMSNNQIIQAERVAFENYAYCSEIIVAKRITFRVVIPLDNIGSEGIRIKFQSHYERYVVDQCNILTGKYAPVSIKLSRSWFVQNGYLLQPCDMGFIVRKAGRFHAIGDVCREVAFLGQLLTCSDLGAKKAIPARLLYHLVRPFMPKDIWLVMDRADRADDNGEAFFRYLVSLGKKAGCHPIFALRPDSPDYERLRSIGSVVPYLSWRHKLLHLLARHTISAYTHSEISSPFFNYSCFYGDILQKNKIVFLQHGVTQNNVSSGVNRYNKNYALFITSSSSERESIIRGNYGYSEDQVVLTGMPRYDYLKNDSKKYITVMPTWSSSLFGRFIPEESRWELLPGFEESKYYRMYTALLNDARLHDAALKRGYAIRFMPHPALLPYIDRFKLDNRVILLGSDTHYRDVFAESALITTDYSSVAFDFAYLEKPIIYTQFTELHYVRGYFDYERDGFGEIERTVDDAVTRLIEYMQNDCRMKEIYQQRVRKFFEFHDDKNCERVYHAIKDLDARNNVR